MSDLAKRYVPAVAAFVALAVFVATCVAANDDGSSTRSGADLQPVTDCVAETFLPCLTPTVELALPIPGTPLTLAYSSERARLSPDIEIVESWLDKVGLGGWTPDFVHRLDVDANIVHLGDGGIRSVEPIELSVGEHAGLLAVADDVGEVALFNADGLHVATVDALDGLELVSMGYGDQGRLSEIRYRDSTLRLHRAVEDGEISIETVDGRRTRVEIDDAGHLARATDVVGAESVIETDPSGLITDFTLPDGGSYRFIYDDDGRLVEELDPFGAATRWTRTQTDDGYRVASEDSAGATTVWEVDVFGDTGSAVLTGPDGLGVTEEWTEDGHTISWPDGTVVDLRLGPDPRWQWQTPLMTVVQVSVDGEDQLTMNATVEVDGGGEDPFAVDSIRESWDVGGDSYSQMWDRAAREITFTTPAGRVERATFDGSGRMVGYASGEVKRRQVYDDDGWMSSMQWGGDDGPTVRFEHEGRSITVSGPEGLSHAFDVDDAGRIARLRIPNHGEVQIKRLGSGVVSVVDPAGGGEGRLGYAVDGRLASFEFGGELLRTWKYDEHGRAAGYENGDGGAVTVTYDPQSRPVRLGAADEVVEYRWDESTGLLVGLDGGDVQLSQDYEGGTLVGETWSGAIEGTVRHTLDDRLRLSEITVNDAHVPFDHDADGLVTAVGSTRIERVAASGAIERIEEGDVVEERGYDEFGMLITVDVRAVDESVFRLDIARDELGRVVERRERTGSDPERLTAMSYDDAGQLTEVTVDGTLTERYVYDELGNRIRADSSGAGLDVAYDDAGRIVAEGDATYEYDDAGRLSSRSDPRGTVDLDYDPRGLLLEARADDGSTVRYVHDGYGRRVATELDGRADAGMLYLDEQRPVATVRDGVVEAIFGYADDELAPITMTKAGRQYRIISDDTGSPRLVLDAETGDVVQRIDYGAFGTVEHDSAPAFQPFAFGGGIVDPVSGLVRFGYRDYDPSTGRWTAVDPILYEGGDTNLYRYVRNDPVNLSDPSGLITQREALCVATLWIVGGLGPGGGVTPPGGRSFNDIVEECTRTRQRNSQRNGPASGPTRGPRRLPRTTLDPPRVPPRSAPNQWPPSGGRLDRSGRTWRVFWGGMAFGAISASQEAVALGQDIGDIPVDLPGGDDETYGDGDGDASGAPGERFVCDGPPWTVVTAETSWLCDEREDDWQGGTYGHPNVSTWDEVTYAFHGAGDYVLATDGEGWEVQVRFSRIENMRRVSYVRALAVRIGDQVVTVGDSVDKSPWDGAELRVDGQAVDLPAGDVYELDTGSIHSNSHRWAIVHDRGPMVIAGDRIGDPYEIRLPRTELWEQVVGLAGMPDGDPRNDIRSADGTPIDPAVFDELYGTFGASWLVPPQESLFETPLDPVDEDPIFPEANLLLSDFDDEIRRQAEGICREAGNEPGSGLNECMFDLVLTGDARWAEAMGPIAQLTRSGVHWRLIDPRIDDDRAIELGQTIEDELATTGAHRYRFAADAGDRVVLRLTDPCGDETPTTLVAGFVGPDGLVTESISLTDCGDSKPLLIDEDGEFALLVTDEQGLSTSFAFELLAATDQDKGDIGIGETIDGEFIARSDVHAWAIEAGDAEAISVNAIDVPCDATWLLERNGEPVWSDDGCVTSPPLPTGGDLRLLLIADFSGRYVFELFAVPEPVEADLPDDGAVAGEIAAAGTSAVYYVEVEDGQLFQIFSDTENCDLGRVLLDAPSGDVFQGRDLCRDSGPFALPETGRWGVRIDPPGPVTGTYALRVAVVDDTRSGGEAAIGERIEGTIFSPGESVSFELDAAPGDRFQVVAGDTECGLSDLVLKGTDGSHYYFNDLCEDHVIRVDDRGVVRLVVDPDADQTGPFSFRLVPVVTMRGEFAFGEVLQGSIDDVGGRYVFPITVPEGGIRMQIVETGSPCGFSELYWGPPGATRLQYSGEICEDHIVSIEEGGEYELVIDPVGLQTGRFSFRAFEIVEPVPIPIRFGPRVTGSVDTPGAYAIYTFTSTVDDAEFEFESDTEDCDLSQVYFRPAAGGGLRYWDNLCEDHVIRVEEAGKWALVIDPEGGRTGSYSFTLRPS